MNFIIKNNVEFAVFASNSWKENGKYHCLIQRYFECWFSLFFFLFSLMEKISSCRKHKKKIRNYY